jgi:hypothetical protein
MEKSMCTWQVAECAGQSVSRQREVVRATPGAVQCTGRFIDVRGSAWNDELVG